MSAARMGAGDWALLGVLSVLWGGSFFFAKIAVAEIPPLTLALGRVALAAAALGIVLRARGLAMPRGCGPWLAFAGMGVLNNLVPFTLIFWGQTRIGSGLAAILNATTPLWGVVLAHLLTRDERLTPARLGGVLAGFAGVVVMVGPAALAGLGGETAAQLAVLGAALSYGLAGIYGRRFRGQEPLVTAMGQVSMTTLMLVPLALTVDRPWTLPMPGPASWAALTGLALLSTALAYVIFFRILARAGATNVVLVTFLIPVSALLLGTLVLGERLELRHLGGMGLIALGLAAIGGRLPVLPGIRGSWIRQAGSSRAGRGRAG
ncbi:DMT family transporter [Arenibaculum pallidiluteum]|uniref:DMT family transporter n=1 Tax=Arenibaculum pallidiluteum TaxID=2812559 RepID=UPI001A971479|nr:DMT family transporter [Arenibaculum pallidiluteum]